MSAEFLNDPWFNFGVNMLAASAPTTDPRSKSLAWALSQGFQGMQKGQQQQTENERSQQYMMMMAEAMRRKREEAEDKPQSLAHAIDFDMLMRDPRFRAWLQQMKMQPGHAPGYTTGLY